jgi:arylsulfatase
VRRLLDTLGPRLPTLAQLARERGRATLAVVSNHILTEDRGLGRGFDVYDFAPDVRDADATTRDALARLDGYAASDDLLVWVHYIDPHVPYAPPEPLAEAFDPDYAGRYRLHFGSAGGIGDFAYPEDLSKKQAVFRNRLGDAVNAHVRRLYAADIRRTDDAIRALVEGLRARFGPDWTIVFTADHGEDLGEKPFFSFDHGDYVYDGSLRVPLAIVLPPSDPLHRTGVVDEWVSLLDIAPTLIELLALPHAEPEALDGRSLVPALRGETLAPRTLFAESGMSFYPDLVVRRVGFGVRGRFRAVVHQNWKLVFTPGQTDQLAFELYDLASDPGEQHDLFRPDHPAVAPLVRALHAWLLEARQPEHVPSGEDLARLRTLGEGALPDRP